jgi:hypothetical protein
VFIIGWSVELLLVDGWLAISTGCCCSAAMANSGGRTLVCSRRTMCEGLLSYLHRCGCGA